MTDWLARFRALTAGDAPFHVGDKGGDSDGDSTNEGNEGKDTRSTSAIVTIVPIVTNTKGGEAAETPSNALVDEAEAIHQREELDCDTCVVAASGDNSDISDNSPTSVFCDFETRNIGGCSLRLAGAWRYAADPGTEIVTLTCCIDGGEPLLWIPAMGLCEPLASLAADYAVGFVCHAAFEQAIWRQIMVERYGFAPIPITRWQDTQATCAYHALPLDLDRALTVLKLPVVKDKEGRRLTLSLSRFNRKTGQYPELTADVVQQVYAYNRTDVAGVIALDGALGSLPQRERRVWELDQKINQRGIGIDLDFVRAAQQIAARLEQPLVAEFRSLTDGLNPTQVLATQKWLAGRGVELSSLDGPSIDKALQSELSPDLRRVLEIRSAVAASSLKKLDRMLECVGSDGRARGLLQYHGAAPGRWVGRLLQPQNFPRPTVEVKDPEALVAAVKTGDPDALRPWGEPIEVLVSSLRHALVAQDGALFGAGDFSMIEACIVLALAGQHDKCELIASGVDIYRHMAAEIYGLDRAVFPAIPKDDLTPEQTEQRRIGKNTVLGCGFGLGWRKFHDTYCSQMPEAFAQNVIRAYREIWAPRVPLLWTDLEQAALAAMQNPGVVIPAYCGVRYRLETKAGQPFLVCQLINGKKIHYCNAHLEDRETPWGRIRPVLMYWAMKNHQWRKVKAWGGHLTENVVQALARELLVDAMFRFEDHGFPIILTCHDEIVVEHGDIAHEIVKEIMSEPPPWAAALGVPIAIEAWIAKRYQK